MARERDKAEGGPTPPQDDPRLACPALTALANCVEAAIRLRGGDTPSALGELGEAVRAQETRARKIAYELYDLLGQGEEVGRLQLDLLCDLRRINSDFAAAVRPILNGSATSVQDSDQPEGQ